MNYLKVKCLNPLTLNEMKTFEEARQEFIETMFKYERDGAKSADKLRKTAAQHHLRELDNRINAKLTALLEAWDADKWKPYPENVPTENIQYLVKLSDNTYWIWKWEKAMPWTIVTDFRELPYKPE
jgi:hypothetical protein